VVPVSELGTSLQVRQAHTAVGSAPCVLKPRMHPRSGPAGTGTDGGCRATGRGRHHEQAAAAACSITSLDRCAHALVAVADALMAREDMSQALHVAPMACAVGRWTTVLRLVLSLEPSAARVLTDL
jgi:hypothetical protein